MWSIQLIIYICKNGKIHTYVVTIISKIRKNPPLSNKIIMQISGSKSQILELDIYLIIK